MTAPATVAIGAGAAARNCDARDPLLAVLNWATVKGMWWLWLGSRAIGGYALAFCTLWLIAFLKPSVSWLGILPAIDTFVPADLDVIFTFEYRARQLGR